MRDTYYKHTKSKLVELNKNKKSLYLIVSIHIHLDYIRSYTFI
ncbi:hypothetical protein BN175_2100019 [Clostridioides difficile T23]|nr:hypothetical protein BN175_2100019 [Clostridioides difficile T23]